MTSVDVAPAWHAYMAAIDLVDRARAAADASPTEEALIWLALAGAEVARTRRVFAEAAGAAVVGNGWPQ